MEIIYSDNYYALQKELYRMAGQALKENRPTLILVPAQASFMVESGILRECGVQGFLELEVMSFEKLTSRMLELSGGRVLPALDGAGVAMLAKQAMKAGQLRALKTEDELLHQRVGELISALKSEQIFPEQLRELAEGQHASTADKLLDIADIFEQMLALSGGSMMDGRDQEKLAQGKFASSSYIKKQDIILFGFDMLPALRAKTIVELAKSAASLRLLIEAREDAVLYKQWQCVKKLEALARAEGLSPVLMEFEGESFGEIGFLQNNLYAYPAGQYEKKPEAVEIACAANKRKEVEYAAQRILEYTCEQGGKMRDISILAGSALEYESVVRDVFARAGIPFFLESKRALLESNAAEFVLSALDILANSRWRLADVLGHLKCGFLCQEQEETALIRHAKEYGLKGYAFRRGFQKGGEEMEAMRQRVFGPLLEMEKRAKREEISSLLLEYLEQTGASQKLEQQAEELETLGFLAEGRYLRQVYEAIVRLISQTQTMGKGISIAELRQVLAAGFEASQISVIPPATDEVTLGDITHSIFQRKKLVLVLGANEGSLPLTPDGSGVINDYEIAELRKTLPAFPDKMAFDDQKAYLRRGFAAGERLILTYNREDAPPSHIVDRLHKLFPLLEEEQAESRPLRSAEASYDNLAMELRALADGEQTQSELLSAYIGEEQKRLAELLPSISFDNTPASLGKAVARGLYGPPSASVSRMERYFECSYRHFMDYGIRPEKVREFEEDAASAGTYVHDLMDSFAAELAERKLSWAEISDEVLQEVMGGAAEKQREAHNRGIFKEKRFLFSEKRLREEAALAAKAVRSQLEGTSVRVAASEAGFGGDIFSLPTPYGRLTLRGRVDRVDETAADAQTYVRIVDYKTGAKKFSLTDVYYGLNLQLAVYLMAVENYYRTHGKEVLPAGGFYFEIKLPYIGEDAEEKSRLAKFKMNGFILAEGPAAEAFSGPEQSMNLRLSGGLPAEGENTFSHQQMQALFGYTKKMILQAAAQMSEGELSLCPVAEGENLPCRYCDYHAICGFDQLYRGNTVRRKEKIGKERFFSEIGGNDGGNTAD